LKWKNKSQNQTINSQNSSIFSSKITFFERFDRFIVVLLWFLAPLREIYDFLHMDAVTVKY
jgi:hypothetical protein